MLGQATRTEEIGISLSLDSKSAKLRDEEVKTLIEGYGSDVREGDILKIRYTFKASYFGDVEKSLRAISKILDEPGVIRDASLKELIHGRSIVLSVASRLEEIIKKIEDDSGDEEWFENRDERLEKEKDARAHNHWWKFWG